jgi:hypothetical protein
MVAQIKKLLRRKSPAHFFLDLLPADRFSFWDSYIR